MSTLLFDLTPYDVVRKGLQRKIIYTGNIMNVLIDFTDGPWDRPDPYHSHPHEQTSYIAKGEILFFYDGEKEQHLKEGDMFAVPSGIRHTIQLLTAEARLVDSFTPVREDFLKK